MGYNAATTMRDKCVNLGSIESTGYNNVGGIIGYCTSEAMTMMNCANHGDVKSLKFVGGLMGGESGKIYNSYSDGNVTSNKGPVPHIKYAGGLVGTGSIVLTNVYVGGTRPVNGRWISGNKSGATCANVYRPAGDELSDVNDGVASGVSTYADNATLISTLNANSVPIPTGYNKVGWKTGTNGPKLNFEQ